MSQEIIEGTSPRSLTPERVSAEPEIRHTKRSPRLVKTRLQAILDALGAGSQRSHACKAAGVSRDSFYRWLRDFPEIAEQVEQAEAEFVQRGLAALHAAAVGGSWQAMAWLLERKYPAEFGRPGIGPSAVEPAGEVMADGSIRVRVRLLMDDNVTPLPEDDDRAYDAQVVDAQATTVQQENA